MGTQPTQQQTPAGRISSTRKTSVTGQSGTLSSCMPCHRPWLVISFVIFVIILASSFVISFVIIRGVILASSFVVILFSCFGSILFSCFGSSFVVILFSYFVIIPAFLAMSAVILSGNTASTTNTNASDSQLCGASRTHKGI